MRQGLSRAGVGAFLVLAWFSACGGTTSRHGGHGLAGSGGDLGGGDGESSAGKDSIRPESGSTNAPGEGGASSGGVRGLGGVPGQGDAGETDVGGASVGGTGQAGELGSGGAAGTDAAAGAGGGAGSPTCCSPLDCKALIGGLQCAPNPFRDGCGSYVVCGCPKDEVCTNNHCGACDPGPDPCAANPSHCGQTHDSCGNPITCPDQCQALLGPLGACYDGACCAPTKTTCAVDDCGFVGDGCGAYLDCTGNVCPNDDCRPNGKCCTPSAVCAPDECGYIDDGCGDYVDCGGCDDGTTCLDHQCVTSICAEQNLHCDIVYNPAVSGYEFCGVCPQNLASLDHHCWPFCSP